MKKALIAQVSIFVFLAFVFLASNAGAFDNYAGGCNDCHGNFPGTAPYVSQHDGVAWKNPTTGANRNLHDSHRTDMLNSDCNVCHSGSSRTPVYLNSSNGGTGFQPIGCTGCHDGDGLRAHHENSGAYTCYDCHDPGTPPAENIKPAYYFTPDTAHPNKPTDPCNANGSESRVAPSSGLDNDGNLLYDQNDPACAPAPAPKIGVSPATLTFGNQNVGTTSTAQTVTISNTGNAALTVNSISNGNATDFALTSPATPFNVAAGASQTFTVAFKPATTGAKSATISITSDGGNGSVSASGTGTTAPVPVLGVSPTTLTFGNQTVGTTSAAQTVTISNTGTAPLNVTSISSSSTEFKFSPATVSPIAAGGSATLSVTFAPVAPTGPKSATISITSDGGNGSVSASGTGTTTTPPPPGGDVALTKLVVPAKVSARSSKSLEIDAFATTTVKEVKATVNLAASPGSGVTVKMEHASVTETLKSERAKKLGFQARITCTKKGTWPVNWTAKISAAQNSDPANDTLTGTTQVTCNGSSHDD